MVTTQKIANAARDGQIRPNAPFVTAEPEDVRSLLCDLTTDFAARLRDATSEHYPHGLVLTLHRSNVQLPEGVSAEGIKDEAGTLLQSADANTLSTEPELPLPDDVISYVQVRVASARLGIPEPADYELFCKLEAEGNLGFGHPEKGIIRADNMVISTCTNGEWTDAMVVPHSKLSFSPNMQALHYGSAMFEGMTAEWAEDGSCNVFGMKDHYERMRRGAVKLGTNPVPWGLFREAIMKAIQQNARFIPRNGRLYIRPHCADIGPQMRVGNSKMTGFFVEVTPIGSVGSYFGLQESNAPGGDVPMKVMGIPDNRVRTAENTGDIKAVGNYAQTAPVIRAVRSLPVARLGERNIYPDGVLYIDRVEEESDPSKKRARICETNASNTIFFQDIGGGRYRVVAPSLKHGDILPGNTRRLILEKTLELGWEVDERDVRVEELSRNVFCGAANCGTAALLSHFDAVIFAHIDEDTGEDHPGIRAAKSGPLIEIRNQQAVNADPVPRPVIILLDKLLDVKAGRSGQPDREKYLTQVPGLRLQKTA